MTPLHLNVNRNERSTNLDLKEVGDHARALDLIGTADVLVPTTRTDALRRLGMDYDVLVERNPKLVHAHAQGFRPDSDQARLAAHGETVQAASGLLHLAERAGDLGFPVVLPSSFADEVTALPLVRSAPAALGHQRATGRGQVEAALLIVQPGGDDLAARAAGEAHRGEREAHSATTSGAPICSGASTPLMANVRKAPVSSPLRGCVSCTHSLESGLGQGQRGGSSPRSRYGR